MAFPDSLDSDFGTIVDSTDYPQASHINTLRRAVEGLEDKMGIDGSSEYYSMDYKVNKFFVPATKLYFYADSPPTGWTTDSVADKVLAVKGGSTYTTGGSLQGTWTPLTHTHTVTILVSGWGTIGSSRGMGTLGGNLGYGTAVYGPTANRNFTSAAGAPANTYRPYAAVGIIAYNGNFLEYHDS